jgi:hypothetical protein
MDTTMTGSQTKLELTDPIATELTARAIARGAVVGHAFGNFYVITTRPDAAVVRGVNLMKGRPADQVGSLTTTRALIPALFDWTRLPPGLARATVQDLIDRFFEMGPFGFRGPAGGHLPDHLAAYDGAIRTTQVIAPGYACPSNSLLAQALNLLRVDYLYITSANRSRHQTGAEDEPAHYTAAGLLGEFGHEPNFVVLHHGDEGRARAAYPQYAPMSTTIIGFHKLGHPAADGRPSLILERHGSLPVEIVRSIVAEYGFGLELGPKATHRLALREYADLATAA